MADDRPGDRRLVGVPDGGTGNEGAGNGGNDNGGNDNGGNDNGGTGLPNDAVDPFPPAALIAHLEAAAPGASERLLNMVERDQESLIDVRRKEATATLETATAKARLAEQVARTVRDATLRAHWIAFGYLFVLGAGLFYSVYEDQSFAIGALAVACGTGIVVTIHAVTANLRHWPDRDR